MIDFVDLLLPIPFLPSPPKSDSCQTHISPPPHTHTHIYTRTPTGAPSPAALRRDVECLVRMARDELGVKRVGLHGESVGGLVAAHAAARCVSRRHHQPITQSATTSPPHNTLIL